MKDTKYSINPKYWRYYVMGIGTLRTRKSIEEALTLELDVYRRDLIVGVIQKHDYKTGVWVNQ